MQKGNSSFVPELLLWNEKCDNGTGFKETSHVNTYKLKYNTTKDRICKCIMMHRRSKDYDKFQIMFSEKNYINIFNFI